MSVEVSSISKKRLVLHEHVPLATPLVIYIEPSGYCNLRCKFCPHGIKGAKFKRDIMSLELFKKMTDDLAVFDEKIALLRICGNGEPLLNENIVNMIKYAYANKIAEKIELVTNGILLNKELIENLPLYLDRVICSIEGLSTDEYKRISGVNVDFPSFLSKLSDLYANRGDCRVHIKINSAGISSEAMKAKFFNLFSDKCDEIFIENIVPMWPQYDTSYSTSKFRWTGDGEKLEHKTCVQIFKGMQVQANGEVVPCCVDWNRKNIIGDINTSSLKEIWYGRKLRELQIAHLTGRKSEIEPCKNCAMNDYCDVDNIDLNVDDCLSRLLKL